MSELSARLVRVAEAHTNSQVSIDLGEPREIAVAVLRELARQNPIFTTSGSLFRLADEIEGVDQ